MTLLVISCLNKENQIIINSTMKILVPTDFSATSFNALKIAKNMAKKTNGEIILLHVIEAPSASISSTGEVLEDMMAHVYIAQLYAKVGLQLQNLKDKNNEVNIKTLRRVGDPYKEIKDLIREEKADFVVIGEKGVSDIDDLFIGSLTDKVVRSSKCPVITVNQSIENHPVKNILYATDLKQDHTKLLKVIKQLQELFDAKLHIVKINTKDNFSNDIDTKVKMRQLVDKHQLQNCTLNTYNHADEEYGIVYYADEINADLITMGIHKRTGIRRLINGGDLAVEVAEHSHRPVLTYHFDHND